MNDQENWALREVVAYCAVDKHEKKNWSHLIIGAEDDSMKFHFITYYSYDSTDPIHTFEIFIWKIWLKLCMMGLAYKSVLYTASILICCPKA